MKRTSWLLLVSLVLASLRAGPATTSKKSRPLPRTLKVLTYNVGLLGTKLDLWGLIFRRPQDKGLAPFRQERAQILFRELPDFVRRNGIDIVLLQEVWCDYHIQCLRGVFEAEEERPDAPFRLFRPEDYGAGIYSSGMIMLVKKGIRVDDFDYEAFAWRRESAGFDRITRKGMLHAWVTTPAGDTVGLIGVHLIAFDSTKTAEENRSRRETHIAQAEKIDRQAAALSKSWQVPVIVAGDFNVGPGYFDENYRWFLKHGYRDTYFTLHPGSRAVTWDPVNNLIVRNGYYPLEPPAFIDLAFYRQGGSRVILVPKSAAVVFRERYEHTWRCLPTSPDYHGEPIHLSDHYGVVYTWEFRDRKRPVSSSSRAAKTGKKR